MSDYFDSAQSNIDDRKRASLEAMARAGTDGKKAYEDEIARIQAQKQQAVQAALAQAAQRGAPAQLNDQLAQQIGSGYDRRADDLRAGLASRDAGGQALQGANAAYFDQASAAIPSLRARGDRQLEQIKAKAAADEEDRQMRLMLSQLQLQRAGIENDTAAQKAQTSASTARAKAAGGDLSDSELRTRLLGAARVQTDAAPAAVKNLSVFGVKLPQLSQTGIAKNLGSQAGLDPARVAGVLLPKAAAGGAKAPTAAQKLADMEAQAKLQRVTIYNNAKRAASPETFFEFEKALNPDANGGKDPVAYINGLKDSYLANAGISRASLLDWVKRYMAV